MRDNNLIPQEFENGEGKVNHIPLQDEEDMMLVNIGECFQYIFSWMNI